MGAAEQVGHGRATGCNGTASVAPGAWPGSSRPGTSAVRSGSRQPGWRTYKKAPIKVGIYQGGSKQAPTKVGDYRSGLSPPPAPAADPRARTGCRYAAPGWRGSAQTPWAGRLDVLQREELFVQLVVAALAVPDHAVHLVRQALALDHQADPTGRAPRRVRNLCRQQKISPARIGMSRTAPSSCTFSTISPSSW